MEKAGKLDLSGVGGGQAAVRLREALRWMERGEVLTVAWDDPQVGTELEMFCQRSGDDFRRLETEDHEHGARITRTNRSPIEK